MPYYWKIGGDTYHWHRNCHLVPSDVETNPEWKVSETKPSGKEQCYSCKNRNKFLSIFLGGSAIAIIVGFAIDQYFEFKLKTLFWVSSTIIQSLVALIAFLAVIYIYRVTRVRDIKEDLGFWLEQQRKYLAKKWNLEEDKIHEIAIKKDFIYKQNHESYKKKKSVIEKVRLPMKQVTSFAVITIIISLFTLPFGDFVISDNPISCFPLFSIAISVEIVFSIITIIFAWRFIKTVI